MSEEYNETDPAPAKGMYRKVLMRKGINDHMVYPPSKVMQPVRARKNGPTAGEGNDPKGMPRP